MAARTAKGRGSTSHARHADAKRVHGTAPLYREKLITEQATYQKVGPHLRCAVQLWGTFKEVVGVGVHKSAHSEGVLTFLLLSIVVN